ncbi:MAG TPA: DoxX family protein [Rubrivivax sp.]|nr:DoxX family protein [Rubrivivax sp.]
MNTTSVPILAARILLALIFMLAGLSKLTGLQGTTAYIASQGLPMPAVLALASGLLELLAGLAVAIGFKARLAAALLAAFTLLASLLFHNFWAMPADQAMVNQLMFMKNLAIVGGLLLIVAHGAGPVSVDTRRLAIAH